MKLSKHIGADFHSTGEVTIRNHTTWVDLDPQAVARLRRALNARADVTRYLSRQRMKRAMKGDAS